MWLVELERTDIQSGLKLFQLNTEVSVTSTTAATTTTTSPSTSLDSVKVDGFNLEPFDHPISHTRSLELGQFGASHFGRFWVHLEVKKSILVKFLRKNGNFFNFPKAATGSNFGLFTIRFRVPEPRNWGSFAPGVSSAPFY